MPCPTIPYPLAQVFDCSRDKPHRRESGFYFPLGGGAVIPAWDLGFAALTVGSKAVIEARHDYAYGERGMPESGIPSRAVLLFEVELMDAKTMSAAEVREVDAKVAALRR